MTDSTENPHRLFLVDDHPAVRDGLKLLFSTAAYTICGEAENSAETLARVSQSGAGLAILDLSLGDESGFELIGELRRRGVAILIYSMHEDAGIIRKTFDLGASGYVSKREKSAILRQAVVEVLAGRRYVSPRAAQSFADEELATPLRDREQQSLTEREHQVLALLGRGEANADIATVLAISIRTVETHFARIIAKLKLGGMKELRRYAIQNKP